MADKKQAQALITHAATVGSGALTIQQDLTLSQLGATFAQSGMFSEMNTPAKCVVKILTGQELGIGPSASMRGIHVYQGKIELGAALLMALVNKSGYMRADVVEASVERSEIKWTRLRDDKWVSPGPNTTFTLEDARRAGLTDKSTWKGYPEDMTYSRALSRGFRRYCPELASGSVYVTGELHESEDPTAEEAGEPEGLGDRLRKGVEGEAVEEAQEKPQEPTGEVEAVDTTAGPERPAGGVSEPQEAPEAALQVADEPKQSQGQQAIAFPEAEDAVEAPEAAQGASNAAGATITVPADEDAAGGGTDANGGDREVIPEDMTERLTAECADMSKTQLIAAVEGMEVNMELSDAARKEIRISKGGHTDLAKLTKAELTRYYVRLWLEG